MKIVSMYFGNLPESGALKATASGLSPNRYRPICRYGFSVLLAGVLSTASLGQTTYYVATNGNDNSDGRSPGSAFQSLAKVNTLPLLPGDQVLFRRGDTFRGSLTIRRSGSAAQPILFDAFGSGQRPVLAGSAVVSGWSSLGGNLWQASCAACGNRVTGLYRNGEDLPLGRYPNLSEANKGYLTIGSHQGKSQLTSQQGLPLNLNTGWAGAEVVVRATQWIMDRYGLGGQSGSTLSLSGDPSGYGISDSWGFFVQNHPATLDQVGEWAFESNARVFRLYSTSNPNEQLITATVQATAVDVTNVSNVTLRNLRFAESLSAGLSVSNSSNLTFSAIDVANAGEDGVLIRGVGSNILIENSQIQDVSNNGMIIDPYQNVIIRNTRIRRIGIVPGRGKSGDGQYNGVLSLMSQNLLMEDNVVEEIGYNAISFTTGTTLRRNVVSNFCLTKSDGGGLYTWNGNQANNGQIRLLSNIVFNSIGAPEGTPGGAYSGANGIYLDDCAQNAELNDNTVFNCNGFGIYLHATNNARLNNNTVFDNTEAQLAILPAGNCAARNNVITNNILVSRLPDQLVGKYESNANDIAQYGTFDYNYYLRPFEDVAKIRVIYNNGGYTGGHYSVAQWRNLFGKDANSKDSPITYPATESPDDNIRLVYNPTGQPVTVSLNGNYRDAKNQAYSGSVTLAPFTSLVLLRENGTPPPTLREPENPANAVAGLDYRYYEGNWATLPDFNAITPVKTGTAALPDISPRSRDDFFGLRFTGFVNVPADGAYTFYVSSDDGSKLFIGSTEVVSHDGTHAQTEKSGSIGLKAGRHAITIVYFENNGGEGLSVSYSGPGLNKQAIPASALFRVGTGTPPSPTLNLREPENPANAVAGLDYRYYEGNWNSLPDFNAITPVKSGTLGVMDLSPRNRPEHYGLRFTGFVEVPADGSYSFFTNSDDGSKLFIGSTEVVNNDGPHAMQERSGVIGLKAGRHAITLVYFQATGGQGLSVSYSGPGLGKQAIPASAFFRVGNAGGNPPPTSNLREPENPAGAVAGLDYRYYEGSWNSLPDFNAITPVKTGTTALPSLGVSDRGNNFGLRFTGFVEVPTDGSYSFFTNSDDGSKLFIGSTEVVNNDGSHPEQERSGSIGLKAGRHAITVIYYEGGGGEALSVSYSGPNVGKQTIPASALFRVGNPSVPATAGNGTGLRANYFNNATMTGSLVLNRIDATINFEWINDSPAVGTVNADNYSVRWTGQVEAPVTGSYTFSTISDDGVRLWVNNQLIISNWAGHAATTDNGTITLTGGQRYDIRLEYYEAGGESVARLLWAYPDQGQQVVPQNRLYPAASGARTGVIAATEGDVPVLVYPIPAREQINIRYPASVAGSVGVELVNPAGQVVLALDEPVVIGENRLAVPVGRYSRGVYLLRLTQGGRRVTRKVILIE